MGYIRRPSYYNDFKCIAGACTDSCCKGWDIDIDDDTYAYYMSVKGAFGKRLKNNIEPPCRQTGEQAHFISTSEERCPFLNEHELCDIILTLGEEHISQICTYHPRYFDWLVDGEEGGVGLVCEEAARLILQKTGYPEFTCEDDGMESEPIDDEDLLFEKELQDALLSMREELFAIIKSKEPATLDDIADALFEKGEVLQGRYDALVFPDMDEPLPVDAGVSSEHFWTSEFIQELLQFYMELEINDPAWFALLKDIHDHADEICANRTAFLDAFDRAYEYEQLLIYFIYRYLLKAREDDCLFEKIAFAVLSVRIIELLDIHTWMSTATLTEWQQIEICKFYSKEIEYDEANVEAISMFFRKDS